MKTIISATLLIISLTPAYGLPLHLTRGLASDSGPIVMGLETLSTSLCQEHSSDFYLHDAKAIKSLIVGEYSSFCRDYTYEKRQEDSEATSPCDLFYPKVFPTYNFQKNPQVFKYFSDAMSDRLKRNKVKVPQRLEYLNLTNDQLRAYRYACTAHVLKNAVDEVRWMITKRTPQDFENLFLELKEKKLLAAFFSHPAKPTTEILVSFVFPQELKRKLVFWFLEAGSEDEVNRETIYEDTFLAVQILAEEASSIAVDQETNLDSYRSSQAELMIYQFIKDYLNLPRDKQDPKTVQLLKKNGF